MATKTETTTSRMIPRRIKQFALLSLVASSSIFCTQNQTGSFSEFQSTNGDWKATDVKKFTFEQNDSTANHSIYLNLQANNDYPFSNIFLITKIHTPSEQSYTDTLQYAMTDEYGKLLGDGLTDTKTSKLLYKENYKFKENGVYTIEVEQAVRKADEIEGTSTLKGITSVGLTIEKQ